MMRAWRGGVRDAVVAIAGVAVVTWAYFIWLHVTNATTVALSYLLLLLFVAASARPWVAMTASMAAALAFNFFFLPPVGTLLIADPQNWLAFVTFLVVSLVASRLSSVARERQREAVGRRDELGRLFELSRDVLRANGGDEAIRTLAHHVAQRFALDYVAICLLAGADFDRYEAGTLDGAAALTADLQRALSGARLAIESGTRGGGCVGQELRSGDGGRAARLVPLHHGARTIGILALVGRRIEPGALDALASIVAIAIEPVDLLETRTRAEVSRRSFEIKSALL